MAEKLITVAKYRTAIEAHMAGSVLEEEGIRCVTEDEESVILFGSTFGAVKLKVRESEWQRAKDILGRIGHGTDRAGDE